MVLVLVCHHHRVVVQVHYRQIQQQVVMILMWNNRLVTLHFHSVRCVSDDNTYVSFIALIYMRIDPHFFHSAWSRKADGNASTNHKSIELIDAH